MQYLMSKIAIAFWATMLYLMISFVVNHGITPSGMQLATSYVVAFCIYVAGDLIHLKRSKNENQQGV